MSQCSGFGNWCTGWFDGTWGHCCAIHDVMYTLQYPKLAADIDLGSCVARNGPDWMGWIMAAAVIVFGWGAYKTARFYKIKEGKNGKPS